MEPWCTDTSHTRCIGGAGCGVYAPPPLHTETSHVLPFELGGLWLGCLGEKVLVDQGVGPQDCDQLILRETHQHPETMMCIRRANALAETARPPCHPCRHGVVLDGASRGVRHRSAP